MRYKQEWVAEKKDTPTKRNKCAENQKKLDTVIKNGTPSKIFNVKILCEGVLNANRTEPNPTQFDTSNNKNVKKKQRNAHYECIRAESRRNQSEKKTQESNSATSNPR